jgi:SnoaL-like domain
MTPADDLERRIGWLEDRSAIMDLAVLYGVVMDERDMPGIRAIFSPDAEFASMDGILKAPGIDEIVATFEGRFDALGPTNHFVHGHVVRFDEQSGGRAYGFVSAHAELYRLGRPMVVALRYRDEYRRDGGRWQFRSRCMGYMYYADAHEYPAVMAGVLRNRAYNEPLAADWPEALASPAYAWVAEFLPRARPS